MYGCFEEHILHDGIGNPRREIKWHSWKTDKTYDLGEITAAPGATPATYDLIVIMDWQADPENPFAMKIVDYVCGASDFDIDDMEWFEAIGKAVDKYEKVNCGKNADND